MSFAKTTSSLGLLRVGELLLAGASAEAIAAELGISTTAARDWIRDGKLCRCARATRFRDGVCRVCRVARCEDCGERVAQQGTRRCQRCFAGVRGDDRYECRGCNETKPASEFSPRPGHHPHRPVRSLCRGCEYDGTLARNRKHPEKKAARNAVYRALRAGRLERAPCAEEDDSCRGRVEARHADYSKPLEVTWLCQSHAKRV